MHDLVVGLVSGRHHHGVDVGVVHAVHGIVEDGGVWHTLSGTFGERNMTVGQSADLCLRFQAGEDLQVRHAHVAQPDQGESHR